MLKLNTNQIQTLIKIKLDKFKIFLLKKRLNCLPNLNLFFMK